jgi:pimeloyl-ACP methyl ester carboxylesterase
MGGSIALVLARRRPELVARLVLVEPNLDPGDGGASVWIARQSEQEFVDRGLGILIRGAADGWASTLRIADPRALHRSAVGLCRGSTPTMREILLGLEIPRTLIWGALSTAPAGLDRLVSAGAAFCAVGGSGHVPMEDNPAGFAELLEDALRVPSGD